VPAARSGEKRSEFTEAGISGGLLAAVVRGIPILFVMFWMIIGTFGGLIFSMK
jgi:hypothetical protein